MMVAMVVPVTGNNDAELQFFSGGGGDDMVVERLTEDVCICNIC